MKRITCLFLLCIALFVPTYTFAQNSPTNTVPANESIYTQLEKMVTGLIYTSESDSEISADSWTTEEVKSAQNAQEAALALYTQSHPEETSPSVTVKSVSDFFANMTVSQSWWGDAEHEQATKFNKLIAVLQKLNSVQVIKIGKGPEKTVYILGIDTSNTNNKMGTFTGITLTVTES
jgi:hypothetical protein